MNIDYITSSVTLHITTYNTDIYVFLNKGGEASEQEGEGTAMLGEEITLDQEEEVEGGEGEEEVKSLVLDNGSGTIKAGFAGDGMPLCSPPSPSHLVFISSIIRFFNI